MNERVDSKVNIDIYSYTNYLEFLRAHFEERKRLNRKFSFRVFARQAGFRSGSTPKMIIDGKRQLTLDSIRKFAIGLQLNKRETAYFEALVEFAQADTADKKAIAIQKIKTLPPKHKTTLLDQKRKDYVSKPYFVTLREMVQLSTFKEDSTWVAQHLIPQISPLEVREAFKVLQQLGLIMRDSKKRLAPSDPVISTPMEVTDMDVFSYHLTLLKQATESLNTIAAPLRHNAALTFPVPLRKMQEIKKKIAAFQQSLIEFVDDGKNDFDEIYHMSISLFPATRTKGKTS